VATTKETNSSNMTHLLTILIPDRSPAIYWSNVQYWYRERGTRRSQPLARLLFRVEGSARGNRLPTFVDRRVASPTPDRGEQRDPGAALLNRLPGAPGWFGSDLQNGAFW
jgi:hypothetical protein